MITLRMSHDSFINDIHPLVRSFFPGEDVRSQWGRFSVTPPATFHIQIERDGEELLSLSLPDETENERLRMKNILKCAVYRELLRKTGVELPWGTLSGIRPARLALNRLKEGASFDEAVCWMEDYYLVSHKKAELAVSIAERELKIIRKYEDPRSFSLYVGIPFCPSTCLYCSFPSNAIGKWKGRVGEYLHCLEKELKAVSEIFKGKKLLTLYIGGGTPTTLNSQELKRLFDCINLYFDLSYLKEFTVEAGRPDSIDRERLKVLREYGVDRISVNPQSMNQKTLDLIGRKHKVEDTIRAFNLCREMGFDNINMDMILGLPNENEEDVAHTLSEIASLRPDDLTIHSLALKRGSALLENIEKYGYECMKNNETVMKLSEDAAKEMGLLPYYIYRQKNMSGNFENTGWARPGKEGLYNIFMMEEAHSIPAVGAGTVSKAVFDSDNIKRCGNVKEINEYMSRTDEMIERKVKLYSEK